MNNKFLEEALLLYGKEYTTYLKKAIKGNKPGKPYNSVYTGKLYNSIKAKVIKIGNELELLIEAEEYITSLDQGLKPGTNVDLNDLTKWVSKRLRAGRNSRQIAWLIQRKINYIPSTNNVRFALQNCSFGAYVSRVGFKNSGFGFAQYFMTTSGTNPCVIAYFDFGVGIGLNGAASGQTGPATQQPFRGLISVVRKNNLLSQQNRGLDINTIQNSAVSQSTTAFTILERLSNISFSTDTVGFAFIGSGDINIQALNRRVQEYMVAIGANVP